MRETHRKPKDHFSGLPVRTKLKKSAVSYVMMAPFLTLFTVFVVIPVLSAMVLSFTSFNMLQMPKWVGMDNYIHLLLEDEVFIIALQHTLFFALLTGPLGYVLSFVMAWLINEMPKHLRSFITLVMYAPTLAGNVYFIWKFIFNGDIKGLMNSFLLRAGLIKDPISFLTDARYNFSIVVLVMVWMSLGTGFLAMIAGFQSLDRSYFEAAAIDGVRNRVQEMFFVTLPQMVPQLMFGAVMSISSAFAVGYQSMNLTGFPSTNYSTHTLLLHMLDFGTIRFEMGYASSIAVVLFSIMLFTWFFINRFFKRYSVD